LARISVYRERKRRNRTKTRALVRDLDENDKKKGGPGLRFRAYSISGIACNCRKRRRPFANRGVGGTKGGAAGRRKIKVAQGRSVSREIFAKRQHMPRNAGTAGKKKNGQKPKCISNAVSVCQSCFFARSAGGKKQQNLDEITRRGKKRKITGKGTNEGWLAEGGLSPAAPHPSRSEQWTQWEVANSQTIGIQNERKRISTARVTTSSVHDPTEARSEGKNACRKHKTNALRIGKNARDNTNARAIARI